MLNKQAAPSVVNPNTFQILLFVSRSAALDWEPWPGGLGLGTLAWGPGLGAQGRYG